MRQHLNINGGGHKIQSSHKMLEDFWRWAFSFMEVVSLIISQNIFMEATKVARLINQFIEAVKIAHLVKLIHRGGNK